MRVFQQKNGHISKTVQRYNQKGYY